MYGYWLYDITPTQLFRIDKELSAFCSLQDHSGYNLYSDSKRTDIGSYVLV